MKRILALTTTALLSASLFATPALAQVSVDTDAGVGATIGGSADSGNGTVSGDTDADVKLKAGADANTDEIDAGTTAAIDGTFDGALSAIGNSGQAAATVGSMADVRLVNVINVEDLEGANMDAFMQAETENSAAIDELQASIESNAAVKAALEAQSVDPEDVVAASVAADGSLTVYVKS
ncbi:MAG: hypothetical protein JJ913_18695 [Rhizobiaceae bacterium]|nr:hypothetical protein [Rhizobiaceae bacterium]